MKDIFISYSRKDTAIAEKFIDLLTDEGWSVFWDVEILPGKAWSDTLEEKLNNCKCIVVLWSTNSMGSDYVKEEAALGKNASKLVPIMIEDGISPPFGFGMIEAAILHDWDGDPEHREYQNLVKAITEHVKPNKQQASSATREAAPVAKNKRASVPVTPPTSRSSSTPTSTEKSKTPLIAGLVVGILALMIGGFFLMDGSETPVVNTNPQTENPADDINDDINDDTNDGTNDDTNDGTNDDTKATDNTAAIGRLRKNIDDVNIYSKRIMSGELQAVSDKKKQVVAPDKLTALQKTRDDLDARMKQWIEKGSDDVVELKSISEASVKYLDVLKSGVGEIFKAVVIPTISSEAKGLIAQLFGNNESKRKGARNKLMKTYGSNPEVMGALVKQMDVEFVKDFNNNGIFQAIWALNDISKKNPEALRPHKKALSDFVDKAKKVYKPGTQGQMNSMLRNLK